MITNSEKINKIALLVLILFILSTGASITSRVLGLIYPMETVVTLMNYQVKLLSFVYHFFGMILNIGCSIWLYFEARSNDSIKWLWAFVGLFAGVLGVILWILSEILKEMRSKKAA